LVNVNKKRWKDPPIHHFFVGSINYFDWAIFNSKLLVHPGVIPINTTILVGEFPLKSPLKYHPKHPNHPQFFPHICTQQLLVHFRLLRWPELWPKVTRSCENRWPKAEVKPNQRFLYHKKNILIPLLCHFYTVSIQVFIQFKTHIISFDII
jgi:hypothetical protein